MPIPVLQYQPGTPEQVSPYANLISNALRNYQSAVSARYAPQTTQANIFSKEFEPLARIASNPVAMAMMGDQGQGIMNAIQQLLSQNGGISSGGISGGMTGGVGSTNTSNLGSTGGGGGVGNNPSTIGNDSQEPGLPHGNIQQSAAQKALAATHQQLNPPGITSNVGGEALTTPAMGTVSDAQTTANSIANLKEMIPAYFDQGYEFTTPKGSALNRFRSGASAISERIGAKPISKILSEDPDLAGRWNNFETEKSRLGVLAQKVFPTTNSKEGYEKHMEMLELRPNDTWKSFTQRRDKFLEDLDIAEKNAKKAMNAGSSYNVNPESKNIYGPSNAISNEMKKPMKPTKKLRPGTQDTKNINGAIFDKIGDKWYAYLGE